MRVVVTGAAGFIASHLSEGLLDEGHEVIGVDAFIPYYPRAVKEKNLTGLTDRRGFSFFELDLREAPLDSVFDGADAIVHVAAMPGLLRSWTDFDLYVTCNLIATQRLVDAALRTRVPRLVHISTSSVYGAEATGDETMALQPVSPYGVTKLAAEHLIRAYQTSNDLSVVILRYFSVYGPRQRPDMAYHRFINALAKDEEIVVFGDGQQSRSATYVSDCVRGTVGAIMNGRDGETYNIGGGEAVTVLDVLSLMGDIVGVEPRIRFGDPRPGDQRHTKADTSKAAAHFGYEPKVTPAEGITEQIAWQLGSPFSPP